MLGHVPARSIDWQAARSGAIVEVGGANVAKAMKQALYCRLTLAVDLPSYFDVALHHARAVGTIRAPEEPAARSRSLQP